jgi:signal transduction histidine kinase
MRRLRRRLWAIGAVLTLLIWAGVSAIAYERDNALRREWIERASQLQERWERALSDRQLQLSTLSGVLATAMTREEQGWRSFDPLLRRQGVVAVRLHSSAGVELIWGIPMANLPWRATAYDFRQTYMPQQGVELTATGAEIVSIDPILKAPSKGLELAVGLGEFAEDFARREGVGVAFWVPSERLGGSGEGQAGRYTLVASSDAAAAVSFASRPAVGALMGRPAIGIVAGHEETTGLLLLESPEYRSARLPSVGGGACLLIWDDLSAAGAAYRQQAWQRAVGYLLLLIVVGMGGGVLLVGYWRKLRRQMAERETLSLQARQRLEREVFERQRSEERLRGLVDAMYASRQKDQEMLERLAHQMKLRAAAQEGFVELLRQGGLPASSAEAVESLTELAQQTILASDNLAVWARRDRWAGELLAKPQRVADIIRASGAALRLQLITRRIELTVVADESLYIYADRSLVELALRNLLHNALRHSASGAMISAKARRIGEKVELVVVDFGEGISRERMETIFEGNAGDESAAGGLGIGLPLVDWIVRQHKGQLRVASQPGEGCRITLLWPAADAEPRKE